MRAYARIMTTRSTEDIEIKHDLGIKIVHNGNEYKIDVDNNGRLVFQSIRDPQLVILPQSSNSIEIRSEK